MSLRIVLPCNRWSRVQMADRGQIPAWQRSSAVGHADLKLPQVRVARCVSFLWDQKVQAAAGGGDLAHRTNSARYGVTLEET